MRSPARLLAILFATFAVATVWPVAAISVDSPTPGALRVARADGAVVELPLRHTRVAIEVTAFVTRSTIEPVFGNPFADPVEAVYTFPLGERAAGYQAALFEQERPNVFTQSVANLEPGKTITVRLRTIETLRYERGVYRLTFPLVVGPRYIPGGSVADAARITPPVLAPGTRSGHDVEISVTIDAGVPLTNLLSPSHQTVVKTTGARGATVALAADDAIPKKDFLLRWSVSSDGRGSFSDRFDRPLWHRFQRRRATPASATRSCAPPEATGRSPFDRLVRAIGQSHPSPKLNTG